MITDLYLVAVGEPEHKASIEQRLTQVETCIMQLNDKHLISRLCRTECDHQMFFCVWYGVVVPVHAISSRSSIVKSTFHTEEIILAQFSMIER